MVVARKVEDIPGDDPEGQLDQRNDLRAPQDLDQGRGKER